MTNEYDRTIQRDYFRTLLSIEMAKDLLHVRSTWRLNVHHCCIPKLTDLQMGLPRVNEDGVGGSKWDGSKELVLVVELPLAIGKTDF